MRVWAVNIVLRSRDNGSPNLVPLALCSCYGTQFRSDGHVAAAEVVHRIHGVRRSNHRDRVLDHPM